jgi:hypothetical protein
MVHSQLEQLVSEEEINHEEKSEVRQYNDRLSPSLIL